MKKTRINGPWVIVIIALLLVVVFLVLGNQSFKATENANFDEFNQRQLVLARGAAGSIEFYFENVVGHLEALARMPEIQYLDEARTRQEIGLMLNEMAPAGVLGVGVLDTGGALRYAVGAHGFEGRDLSSRRYYQEAIKMTSGDSYVVEFIELLGNEAVRTGGLIAVPLFETAIDELHPEPSGRIAGVIVSTVSLDTATQRFVASIRSSERGHAFLIDDHGSVLWAPDMSLLRKTLLEESTGFPAFQQILESMDDGNAGVGQYSYYRFEDSPDENTAGRYSTDKTEEKLIAYAPIHLGNELWAVGVWAPKEDARRLIRSAYLVQLLIVALSILVTLIGSSYALVRLQEAYRRVAQERSKVLAAIEASQNAIWLSDADHCIAMVNSAMEALIGRRREELLGQTCRHLLGMHSLEGASICDTICPLFGSTGDNGRVEVCLSPPSGKEVWSEVSFGRVADTNGRSAGVVHIMHDLTERKEIERLKDEFISMVSHELRTPLSHIKGFATTLLQTDVEWDATTQRDFLGSINREADRLTNLVGKILHLSRLEAEGLPLEKEWCQVVDIVDGALQRWHSLTADRQVSLCLSPDLPVLFVDGREIEVVLMNLIENAVKYSDPGTPIMLGVERQGDQVLFSVADQGLGIPVEHRDRIFERFYRVEGVGQRQAGSGLGLAICKHIVEAHGGRIWVESIPGAGSCFYFSTPIDGTREQR